MHRRTFCLAALFASACSAAQHAPPPAPATATGSPVRRPARRGPTIEQLLNVHRASAPSPLPDGHIVAFLSDAPGMAQPFTVAPGPQPAPETHWHRAATFTERVQFARFDPGGRYLWMGRDHGGDENTQLLRALASGDGLLEVTANPSVRHMFGAFRADGGAIAYASNERERGDFDVYVRPVEGAAARRVLEAHGHHEAEDFSPDGRYLVASEEHWSFDTDLDLVDLAADPPARTRLTTHEGDERYYYPRFARDGRGLFVLADRGREFMNLAYYPLPAGPLQFVLDEPHDADLLAVAPAGNALALAVNLHGWTEVRLYDPADPSHPRPLARVELPPAVVSSMAFTRDGRWLFLGAGRASMPNEVFRVEVRTGHAERVTQSDHAGIDEAALVEPTVETVRSFDGVEVPVLLYRPRDVAPGERLPVVVSVHGGPESQATPDFNPVTQFLVGHGYIVATPNVRGSTGYGKRYSHLDDVARREDSVRDLGEVNRWLRARPDVDPDRIAVMGGSYGGYMTLAAITLQPELWAAACDIVGIANFRTFLSHTAAYRRAQREAEYGSLARDGELLDRISPLNHVDRIRAPLMVIHGTNDPRVPVGEAEQIVSALRARGQRVEYMRFEDEGHGLARRENRVRAYGAMVQFFDSVTGSTHAP
jgi:dipeptidyl aminopeptidase/acylaminoacyl peptidase